LCHIGNAQTTVMTGHSKVVSDMTPCRQLEKYSPD